MRNLLLCLLLVSLSFPSQLNAEQPIEPGTPFDYPSLASRTDLTPTFVDQYKLPLDPSIGKKLSRINWKRTKHTAGDIVADLPEKRIARNGSPISHPPQTKLLQRHATDPENANS
jgi:hypothetical protein